MMPASTRPVPAAPRPYAFPAVARSTIANGLKVLVADVARLPVVTVLALVDGGASADPEGQEGVSALTARALAEGRGADGDILSDAFERLGSGFDAESDWDAVIGSVTITRDRLKPATDLLASALTRPELGERDVIRLREERIEELLQLAMEPRGLADEKFNEVVYRPGSRYRLPDGGTARTVRALDQSSVRHMHGVAYAPGSTTLIFVGDVRAEAAQALAEASFGFWQGTAQPTAPVDDRASENGSRIVLFDKPGAPQSELRIGHPAMRRDHPDYFALVVMNALLGGLFSSRINLNLRERNGFTYGAKSAIDWRRGRGPFVASTAVKTDVTARATREVLNEIDRMRTELVSGEELALATAYLDGVFPIRFETTEAIAEAIARAETYELGDGFYSTYRERVRAVTAADVLRVAREHLRPDALRIVAVGDANAVGPDLETLGIGSVERREAHAE